MTMEFRMCIYLGVLLLLHVGSAEHDNEHTAQPAPERDLDLTSNSPIIVPKSSNSTSSTGNNTTTHWEVAIATPQPSKSNATVMGVTAVTSINLTNNVTPKPSVPPTLTSRTPDSTSAHNPSNKTHDNATSHQPLDSLPVSAAPLGQTDPVETHPPTSSPLSNTTSHKTPTTTLQSPTSTSTTISATSTTTSRSTTSSSRATSTSRTSTLTSPQRTSSEAPPSLTFTQAKVHPDTPSQLNVKGDTVMVHDSPTLDPLLAGLVSAFIISAAVITLLLFLKLRRRDNRPEFRRLQDLPMDDMMEETPLSMYSY
ncbi:uncharacterized protein LOC144062287 [Vanacampus margaritifer]